LWFMLFSFIVKLSHYALLFSLDIEV